VAGPERGLAVSLGRYAPRANDRTVDISILRQDLRGPRMASSKGRPDVHLREEGGDPVCAGAP